MNPPFTADQFFDVFRQYNEAVWPAQVVLTVLAVVAVGFCIWRRPVSDRLISAILGLIWAWTGIAYHLVYFTTINKAAFAFGAVFLAGSGAFVWKGVVKAQLAFASTNTINRVLGGTLLVYALLLYPLLSAALGHTYPTMPTFGLPCPTTLFTIGLMCFLIAPSSKVVFVAPVLWSAVGSQAAFLFGVYADIGLLVAGVIAVFLFVELKRAEARHNFR